MFGSSLDIFLAVIFCLLAVVFLMGKGKGLLDLFGNKSQPAKKRTKAEERAYQKAIGIFMLPLAATEVVSIFVDTPVMGLVLAAVAIVDLVIFAKKTKGM